MKENPVVLEDNTGQEIVSVDTVKYSDGSHSVRTTVTTEPSNTISTPFEGSYPTEQDAIDAGIAKAEELSQNTPNAPIIHEKIAEIK